MEWAGLIAFYVTVSVGLRSDAGKRTLYKIQTKKILMPHAIENTGYMA